ncbi:uncharacterized protein LOC117183001 [Belonocnema kinseyi]|uniref:uncharacterized protein LOC117183001 n=1 Tax=Belonocnema kinseyi TaxID=2817044 RepID=UPI00143CF14E|nr:uncharacterized protein LOC117183001 [Belonocnema kinseyi]
MWQSTHFLVGHINQISRLEWNTETHDTGHITRSFRSVTLEATVGFTFGVNEDLGLWFGTTTGRFYSFHPYRESHQFIHHDIPGVHLSKGIVFHPSANGILYYIDSLNQRILSLYYDYDTKLVTGPPQVVFDFIEWRGTISPAIFSGRVTLGRMAIDRRFHLWVPLNGGGYILDIDPTRRHPVVRYIGLNSLKLNACVFGGDLLDILYVSSEPYERNIERPTHFEVGKIFAVSNLGDGAFGYAPSDFDMPPPPKRRPSPESHYWA